jgi:hypothetical protein
MRHENTQYECGEAAKHAEEVGLEGRDGVRPWVGEEAATNCLFWRCVVRFVDGVTMDGTCHGVASLIRINGGCCWL